MSEAQNVSSSRPEFVAGIQAVLDLMHQAGCHPDVEREPGAIMPHSNGYGCWFIADDAEALPGTHPLNAEEIAARWELRA